MDANAPKLSSKYLMYGAFGLGLATAIAVRAIIVLDHLHPTWVRPVWYFAVLGNFVFFYYRYLITNKRKRAVQEHELIHKITTGQPLTPSDREVLLYLLSSIKKSPENLNYLIIFAFSILAIGIDLTFVFLE
ncbi:MAG TPA: hypothetical protein VKA50_13885 [Gammaproteobacteria bacterium]|nr:hypothetical protein [Gammaproteobacteria bacterium]